MDNQNQEKVNSSNEGEQAFVTGLDEDSSQSDDAVEDWWADCDYCNAEFQLSDEEFSQGWYICPECDRLSHLADASGVSAESVLQIPARDDDAEWVQLVETTGAEEAALLVSYLQANGIEAFAWQEGAGRAFGLTIGVLGASHVMVRDDQVQLARSVLEAEVEDGLDDDELADESLADTSKAAMGLLAVTISPLGTGIAYGLAQVLGRRNDDDDSGHQGNLVECAHCKETLELSDQEMTQGWFFCPECQGMGYLGDLVTCLSCGSKLELDETEWAQGWYCCPECDQVTHLSP